MAAIGSAGALAASGVSIVTGTLAATPAGAAAMTFTVTTLAPTGAGSLYEAINDANGNAGDDTITFQAGLTGTITLAGNLPTITDNVDIQGPGAAVIAVDGDDTYHPFEFHHPGASTISGLTVRDGSPNNANNDGSGGAIALYGGPDDGDAGSLTVSNMVLTSNYAGNDGGGIWCHATSYYVGPGQTLYFDAGPLTITNSVISDNVADAGGGGLYSDDCDVTIVASTISGNDAASDGGGLYFDDGTLLVRNSTISGNTTDDDGGGAVFDDGVATFANSTISGNTAGADGTGDGGGLYQDDDELFLLQATITNNTAADGGDGLFADDTGTAALDEPGGKTPSEVAAATKEAAGDVGAAQGDLTSIVGTIIAGNGTVDVEGNDSDGPIESTNSLIGTVAPGTIVSDQGGTITAADPLLGPLADNGGPTLTHALLEGSPAIDAGPDPVPDFPGNEFDQRGDGFPRVVGTRVDIGAYEFAPEPIVVRFTG